MTKKIFLSTLLVSSLLSSTLFAQAPVTHSKYLLKAPTVRKFYVAGGLDAAIFSTATIHHDPYALGVNGSSAQSVNTLGIIRFTYFVNAGVTFNFNFSPHVGLFTGVDIKNIGYIEQDNGYTLKRRTYNVGVPIGIKIGEMANNRGKVFFGGGLDAPINYNEKYFHDRNKKIKLNEWFSDRTPDLMPYAFVGASFNHGLSAKVQYYPNNFLNESYKDNSGNMPNSGTEVNLILFSIGYSMPMHSSMKGHHGHKNNMDNNDNRTNTTWNQ
jgi:hypothetical protein